MPKPRAPASLRHETGPEGKWFLSGGRCWLDLVRWANCHLNSHDATLWAPAGPGATSASDNNDANNYGFMAACMMLSYRWMPRAEGANMRWELGGEVAKQRLARC